MRPTLAILAISFLATAHGLRYGTEISIAQAPYQLSLEFYNAHICGAVIISKNLCMTSASCVYNLRPKTLRVRAGTNQLEKGGVTIQVSKITIHEDYDYMTYLNDIAILELEHELPIRPAEIQAANLPKKNQPIEGKKVNASGWGSDWPILTLSPILKIKGSEIPPNDKCRKRDIEDSQLCNQDNQFTCDGDFGGPLVGENHLLLGIATISNTSIGCSSLSVPGIYSNVVFFREWIQEKTGL